MDVGGLVGKTCIFCSCRERGHWTTERPKGRDNDGSTGSDGATGAIGNIAFNKGDANNSKGTSLVVDALCDHCWMWDDKEEDCRF